MAAVLDVVIIVVVVGGVGFGWGAGNEERKDTVKVIAPQWNCSDTYLSLVCSSLPSWLTDIVLDFVFYFCSCYLKYVVFVVVVTDKLLIFL